MSLKDKILELIKTKKAVSFVELHKQVPDFKGCMEIAHSTHNWIYWQGVSEEAAKAIQELMRDGLIEMDPTSTLTYHMEGMRLDLPLVKGPTKYKTPHWLPVVLNPKAVKND